MGFALSGVTYVGPPISNRDLLDILPTELKAVLVEINGFVAFGGGLHIRGICNSPDWHSLERIWTGVDALSSLYSGILSSDIPFGQDCMGDQFFLRNKKVHRLRGESGEIMNMKMDFSIFLGEARGNADVLLELNPLKQLEKRGEKLEPGQLISAYPPFLFKQNGKNTDLKPISALERLHFLSSLAKQVSNVPDGTSIQFKVANKQENQEKKKPWWKF